MNALKNIQRVYMVGIGGIGMSALAQLYAAAGARVSGSDREESPTTRMLKEKGIQVYVGHAASQVPEDTEILVYSDAVPAEQEERVRGRELGIPELSYFEALGRATEGKRVVAVAGTNGKTTTTAMIGKILTDAGVEPTIVVGSIVGQFGSNFLAGKSDIFVVEACEYRRHFLAFHPEVLVVTNIELDHTDYFKNFDDITSAFNEVKAQARQVITAEEYKKESVPELLLPGEFNRENARAAKAAVHAIAPQVKDEDIDRSLAAFAGTWRRFEYKGITRGGAILYDDYAHHPTAIQKTIEAAHEKFPGKKIVVAFHPHLYSRTRDLFDGFVESLSLADEAIILPVFAARETFDPSVSNDQIAKAIMERGGRAVAVRTMDEAIEKMETYGSETLLFTMGAGDVYKAGEAVLEK